MIKVEEESFLRKWESNHKSLRNQMVFRMPASAGMTGRMEEPEVEILGMPASAGMTDILNRSVRIPSADARIHGDDRHYW